jgi:phage terminase large subunit-like protein
MVQIPTDSLPNLYAAFMREIKLRIDALDDTFAQANADTSHPKAILDCEFCYLQLRRCAELVALATLSRDNVLYVLEDATVRGLSPEGWANRVASVAARWNAGLVVAEANNGGAMIESVLRAADVELKVRLVHARQGKSARAEPVALRFEKGKAKFAGEFPELEAELGGMLAGGGYDGPGRSPDRADALVWAMTVLSETRSGLPRVRRL